MTLSPTTSRTGGASVSSEQARLTGAGLVAEVLSVGVTRDSLAPPSQALLAAEVGLVSGTTVTSLTFSVAAVSAGTTLAQVALYDATFHLVANSVNDTTLTETLGVRTKALSAPYSVPATDLYYAALLCVAPGTPVQVWGIGGNVLLARANGTRPCWLQLGQAALPATATPAGSAAVMWWELS